MQLYRNSFIILKYIESSMYRYGWDICMNDKHSKHIHGHEGLMKQISKHADQKTFNLTHLTVIRNTCSMKVRKTYIK